MRHLVHLVGELVQGTVTPGTNLTYKKVEPGMKLL